MDVQAWDFGILYSDEDAVVVGSQIFVSIYRPDPENPYRRDENINKFPPDNIGDFWKGPMVRFSEG